MNRFRVLIAGNRTQAREGLKAVLGTVRAVHVVGEAADGQEAMRLVKEQGRFATARPLPFVILATVAWIAAAGVGAFLAAWVLKTPLAGDLAQLVIAGLWLLLRKVPGWIPAERRERGAKASTTWNRTSPRAARS